MHRSTWISVLMLVAATAAPAQRTARQGTQRANDSFWLGAGVGGAWLRVSCSICRSDRGTGVSGYVAIGGSAGRRTLIGAEATGRFKRDGSVRERNWGFSAVAFFYPNPRRKQFFWKLGAGVQLYRLEDGTDVLTASPFGLLVGIGSEFPLSGNFRLVPSATLSVASWGGGLKFNGASSLDDISLTMVQIGVGVMRR
jgi:hypothetical protein